MIAVMETLTSTLILILIACLAFVGVWFVMKNLPIRWCWLLAAVLLCTSLACTWFFDFNFPLQSSQVRSSASPAPLWLATLVFFVQSAGVAGAATAAARHRDQLSARSSRDGAAAR